MNRMLMAMVAVMLMVTGALAYEPGQSIVREVYFDLDKAVVRGDAIPALQEVANIMRQYPELGIVLEGYTCDLAANDYNARLARRRADAALNYLVNTEHIARTRVLDRSYGEERPAYPNDTELNRRKNRRVLITLTVPRPVEPVIRSVTTSVLDGSGNFLPDLPNGNFSVTVNGERKEIVRVVQQMQRQSCALGLLLDNSGSIANNELRDAARGFISQRGEGDRLILMSFNENIALLDELSHDRTGQVTLVNGTLCEGFTRLNDGLFEAVSRRLASQPAPRFLVMFSDGVDEGRPGQARGSERTLEPVIAAAKQAGVKILAVELGTIRPEGTAVLKRLAAETGGSYMSWDDASGPAQFAGLIRAMGGTITGTYTIDYKILPSVTGAAVVGSSTGRVQGTR